VAEVPLADASPAPIQAPVAAAPAASASAAPMAAAPAAEAAPKIVTRSVRPWENDPDAWIKRILEQKRTGSEDAAKADLARFVRRYPSYKLPAELEGLVPAAQ
jgi:hypothetical protein